METFGARQKNEKSSGKKRRQTCFQLLCCRDFWQYQLFLWAVQGRCCLQSDNLKSTRPSGRLFWGRKNCTSSGGGRIVHASLMHLLHRGITHNLLRSSGDVHFELVTQTRHRWNLRTNTCCRATGTALCKHGSMRIFRVSTSVGTLSAARKRRRSSMAKLMASWRGGRSLNAYSLFLAAR